MGKTLVTYFSATGTTARLARRIADFCDADLYEIRPAQPYTAADLDWTDSRSRTTAEKNDDSCRPAMAGDALDLSGYDTVFVGFPVWWYVEPRIVDTFLEAHDFAGRVIVPFATSGGSGLGEAPRRMQGIAAGSTVATGRVLGPNVSAGELEAWISQLG